MPQKIKKASDNYSGVPFCKNGHEMTPENTYVRPTGYHECRICARERTRKPLTPEQKQKRADRERALYAEDPEMKRAKNRAWAAANPEKRARILKNQTDQRRFMVEIVAFYKLSVGCVDCGYNAHSEALDCDHLPGTEKLFELSKCGLYTLEEVEQELQKCEVVCANCHRVRTAQRRITLAA